MMKFSLVVATLGRKKELLEFLYSVEKLDYKLDDIEVIIVDQNNEDFVKNEILNYKNLFVKYVHSEKKGLSYNRNIGLKIATGDIICFPDDDCTFYKDTLRKVVSVLSDESCDFCIGRIFDRSTNKVIIKKWPSKIISINKFNSYFLNSSITLFIKKDSMLFFNEDLGVGAKYGSCEDADYIYRLLINKSKGKYNPNIEVWHPEPLMNEISLTKVSNYASGFTHFVFKDIDFIKVVLFVLLISKKIYQFLFCKNKFQKGYFKSYLYGLKQGFK